MDFEHSPKSLELQAKLGQFMDKCVFPNEDEHDRQVALGDHPHATPPIMREIQKHARAAGLWNLFLAHGGHGAGLTNLEYAPLAELIGRSLIGPESINCSAPDTGNMELLTMFGTPDQQREYLEPLLAGTIRSAFAMTEPGVASSDARNIASRIEIDGDQCVINGHKWFTSGILDPDCKLIIFMGVSDPHAPTYTRQSMVLVPVGTPGITVVRDLSVFGYTDRMGHGEVRFDNVRVPKENVLGGFGQGFAMAQARLGPGRMHYAMRVIGFAERAMQVMCDRVVAREAFGGPLADQGVIQQWIARSRIEIEQARLLTLKAAWLMDTQGNKEARMEISAIKVAAVETAANVLDRAIQACGAAGVSADLPIARLAAVTRSFRIADGPDEVHLRSIARGELDPYRRARQAVEESARQPLTV